MGIAHRWGKGIGHAAEIWYFGDSQGQIMALVFRLNLFKPSNISPLGSEVVQDAGCSLQYNITASEKMKREGVEREGVKRKGVEREGG